MDNLHLNMLIMYHISQVCTIDMVMGRLDLKTVTLIPDQLLMKENVDMTLFTITDWSFVYRNDIGPDAGIIMKIVLKRKITNELMTTYLPSILLILITFATTFFKPIYFEAALSVNLTTMLVLTTIFIGVMEELPTTAYTKMVDVWLIFCQLIAFTEVILLTVKEFNRKEEPQPSRQEVSQVVNLEEDIGDTVYSLGDTVTTVQPFQVWQVKQNDLQVVEFIGEKPQLNNFLSNNLLFQR